MCDYAFRVVNFSKALVCVMKRLRVFNFFVVCFLHLHHPNVQIKFELKAHRCHHACVFQVLRGDLLFIVDL
jgi:hypothetical protein